MGLDCTHDAFSGAYSAFDAFRNAVCSSAGGSWPPHEIPGLSEENWYIGEGYSRETHPGLFLLLDHSDCDGEISPEDCALVAKDLSRLLPKLDAMGEGGGHIARDGGYGQVARRFVRGCVSASEAGEALEFR